MTLKSLGTPFLIAMLIGLAMLMLIYPVAYLDAALRGLAIWWDVLFPSLFPFFIISEVLLGFGIVHLIGTLLDPFMKPVFRIPGSGGFVAAMGYVSGYPIGAKLTAQLWEQKMVTRYEGERLVAFTTSSDPIFLIGAVSIGFFHNPQIVPILAIAHYGGGFLVGIIMRYHGSKDSKQVHDGLKGSTKPRINRIQAALRAMHQARVEDGRNLGELLQEAILSSLKLIIVVGGLVVFFSVFLELLTQANIMKGLYLIIEQILTIIGIPPALSNSLVGGLFEVTLGARYAGESATSIPLSFKVAAAAFILSWGGLSVHAQIASILHSTNLRYWPFMIARFIHGILAAGLVLLLWNIVAGDLDSQSTMLSIDMTTFPNLHSPYGFLNNFFIFIILLFILALLSVMCSIIRSLWIRFRHILDK